MAFQAVPETVQLQAVFQQDTKPAIWGLNFRKAGGYSQEDIDTLAETIADFLGDQIDVLTNTHTTFLGVTVRGLEAEFDLISTFNLGTPVVGTLSAVQSSSVAKAFKLGTGFTGRSARGRLYWAGMGGEQLASSNTVTSTFIEDVIALLEQVKILAAALGFIMVIVSRWSNGVKRATGITLPVTQITTSNNTLDSQRRRLD